MNTCEHCGDDACELRPEACLLACRVQTLEKDLCRAQLFLMALVSQGGGTAHIGEDSLHVKGQLLFCADPVRGGILVWKHSGVGT